MPTESDHRAWSPALAAFIVAILGFLPVASWISRGPPDPEFAATAREWLSGSAIALGAGLVLAIVSRNVSWLPPRGLGARIDVAIARWPRALVGGLALGTTALATIGAVLLFNTRPILIDELAQVRQAQIFASGHLWLPVPPHPEFTSSLLMVDLGGRVYSQFPPGGPAMLALGQLLGAPWLVNPLAAGVSVLAFARLAAAAEERPRVRALAITLFALAPFAVFMSASHMNHVTTLMWLFIAVAALAAVAQSDDARPILAGVSGIGFGMAATIRPADALAFAAPAAVWLLVRSVRDHARWRDAVSAAVGVSIPFLAMAAVNAATTGAPLRFGYAVLWGDAHTLGFHRAPWGEAHTPLRGLAYANRYMLELQRYLFESPIPSLLPAAAALALTRRVRPLDRYLLASGGLLLAIYFAYFHQGYYLGPRFVFPLVPIAVLWTARLLPLIETRLAGRLLVRRTILSALAVSAAMAVTVGIPIRAMAYARSATTERWATPHAADDAGVHHALVFVRESWDSQLVARMWALGVSRSQAELLYPHVDACRLELALDSLEHWGRAAPPPPDAAARALLLLLADSAAVQPTPIAPGLAVATQRGYVPAPVCLARVREMMDGITPLAPLLVLHDGNVYVRDLHERDSLVRALYPDRPAYVLHSDGLADGARPRFFEVR